MNRRWVVVLVLLIISLMVWRLHSPRVTEPLAPITLAPVPAPKPPALPTPVIAPTPAPVVAPVVIPKPVKKRSAPPAKKPVTGPKKAAITPAKPHSVPSYDPNFDSVPEPAMAPVPEEWRGNTDTAIAHAGQIVIVNDGQWVRFWTEHHPHEPAPDVDFSKRMIVGVFSGPRPADAFGVTIKSIHPEASTLVVDYVEQLPPTGTVAFGVEVHPYHIKSIPKSSLKVVFRPLQPNH